ncbi:MAG: DUF86 domain-containing protein [Nitrospirae bacterium]|nr:MAG: DUF86 domain-containing protein [Nitrospirota bacterium]
MSSIKVIENKISSVKKYLKIILRYKKYKKEELERNIDIRGAVERYLYLTVQSAIDLAEAVIAYKGFRKPNTMSEAFDILNEERMISLKLTDKLVKMVGFRNIITHDYEKIDYQILYNVLQTGRCDIESFLKKIEEKLDLK